MNFLQTKLNEMKKRKEEGNKGFSLVELIIVIAIMAILVGIVGTQVIPYINRSKEAKDYQLINSYSTAAMTAYTSNAEKLSGKTITDLDVYETAKSGTDAALKKFAEDIIENTGYTGTISSLTGKMKSTKGQGITKILITVSGNTMTTQAYKDTDKVFDPVTAEF